MKDLITHLEPVLQILLKMYRNSVGLCGRVFTIVGNLLALLACEFVTATAFNLVYQK
jgi:hypothetical protein